MLFQLFNSLFFHFEQFRWINRIADVFLTNHIDWLFGEHLNNDIITTAHGHPCKKPNGKTVKHQHFT